MYYGLDKKVATKVISAATPIYEYSKQSFFLYQLKKAIL